MTFLVHLWFLYSLCRYALPVIAVRWQCCCDPHLGQYSSKTTLQSKLEVVLRYNLGEIPLCLLFFFTLFYLQVNPEKCHVKKQIMFMTTWGFFPEICENRASGQP